MPKETNTPAVKSAPITSRYRALLAASLDFAIPASSLSPTHPAKARLFVTC